jgi:hypothetical protein
MAEKDKFDEFLEEVEQDIRQEKYLQLWNKYGRIITGAVAGLLILTAGFNVYSHYETKKRLEAAQKFVDVQQLMVQGQTDQALGVLAAMGTESTKTYPILADFVRAAMLAKRGSPEELDKARDIYQTIASNRKAEQNWQELAKILQVHLEIERGQKEAAELIAQLAPLTKEGAPWRALALESTALLHYKTGDKAKASEIFVQLAQDKDIAEGIMVRAQLMSQILASEDFSQEASSSS